jgi:type I restriction enzyme S subunit
VREGWEERPLSEVCQFDPPKAEVRGILGETDLVSFVPMAELGILERQTRSNEARPLRDVYKGYTYFADGDVLLAKITPCFENGKLGIARGLRNCAGFGSSEFMVLRPGPDITAEYLFYFLSRDEFREAGMPVMTGAVGHKRVPKEWVQSTSIPLPPLAEQERVVAILDEAFDAIAAATANAEKNVDNARELFEQGLRIGFTSLTDSEQLTLQEVATTFARGKSKHRPRNDPSLYGGPYPFIQTGNVREAERYIVSCDQSYNEKGLSQSRLWPTGTVCITIAANIAETAILGIDACFPDSVIGIIVDPGRTTSEYVEYVLRFFRERIRAMGKGSAQDNINLGTFETTKLPFPSLEEQEKLVKRLDLLAAFSKELEKGFDAKLMALAELKQSLLARAFSGALTVGHGDDAPHTPSLRAEGEATQGRRTGGGSLRRSAPRDDGGKGAPRDDGGKGASRDGAGEGTPPENPPPIPTIPAAAKRSAGTQGPRTDG